MYPSIVDTVTIKFSFVEFHLDEITALLIQLCLTSYRVPGMKENADYKKLRSHNRVFLESEFSIILRLGKDIVSTIKRYIIYFDCNK